MAKKPDSVQGSIEPTTEQLQSGEWRQPPHTAEVVVPDGVFAKLAQARELYEELTDEELAAYRDLADFIATGASFAKTGDMSPEAAEELAKAMASGVFGSISVYAPDRGLAHEFDAAIIGTIETANDEQRYFRINPPSPGMSDSDDVVAEAASIERREWWSDNWVIVLCCVAVIIMVAWPITVAVLTADPGWLWWLLTEAIVVVLLWVLYEG